MNSFLAIEIGGTKLQLVAGRSDGVVVERIRSVVEVSRGGGGIREQIARHLPGLISCHQPSAIGVGFGGPVDPATGRIARSHQIEGWSGFELGEWLHEQTTLPVFVDNDANVAALGEARAGAGRESNPVFYMTLGSGIGGGLIVDGGIYHGCKPGESEIGHLRLDRSGTILESRCSGWAVDRRIRQLASKHPDSLLAKLIPQEQGGEARNLVNALQKGDGVARQLLDSVADDLAFGLSHVVHLTHPEVIVLGGGLSLIGKPLQAAVAHCLPRYVMEVFGNGPEVRIAELGEDAVPMGALILAADSFNA